MNLLKETLEDLKEHGKTPSDILWIGTRDGAYAITFETFVSMANLEYDNGFGGQEIPSDLVIVGDSWWLERHEYDGAESWRYKTPPIKSRKSVEFSSLPVGHWNTLSELLSNPDELY